MDIHGLSSSSATNSAIIHSDNTGAIQSKLRTLLSMKVQTSGILILIACILTGCGKSMKDVAGVYETAEIKEPQSSATYYSTTWVLDLAESGTFTLKENRLRKSIVKTREPVPMDGIEESGAWSLNDGRITTTTKLWDEPDELSPVVFSVLKILFDIQSSGDLIAGGQFDVNFVELPFTYENYDIEGLRFKRVE